MAHPEVITKQVGGGGGGGPTFITSPVGTRDWSTGKFSCLSDCGSCVLGWLCPLCLACQISRRLDESCCVPVCAGILPLRIKMRLLLGIKGDICNDTWETCCYGPCVLCQMSRELDAVGWKP
jgi:Cys-rich protein (TIGR01571 family)